MLIGEIRMHTEPLHFRPSIRAEQIDLADVGTLKWLYVQDERGQGLRTAEDAFWIQGKPASGKSYVMKHLVTNQERGKLLAN